MTTSETMLSSWVGPTGVDHRHPPGGALGEGCCSMHPGALEAATGGGDLGQICIGRRGAGGRAARRSHEVRHPAPRGRWHGCAVAHMGVDPLLDASAPPAWGAGGGRRRRQAAALQPERQRLGCRPHDGAEHRMTTIDPKAATETQPSAEERVSLGVQSRDPLPDRPYRVARSASGFSGREASSPNASAIRMPDPRGPQRGARLRTAIGPRAPNGGEQCAHLVISQWFGGMPPTLICGS